MNGHDEFLELLAASIDFGLTEEEVARLNYHLASCPECRRAANELRGQSAAIATTPIAPLAPARSEQILRAALRKPAAKPRWGMLAVAALLATLGGGVLFAGFQLITDDDPAPDQSPPIVAEVSAAPSGEPAEESADPGGELPPNDGPRVTPNPGDDEPPPPADPAKLALPIAYTDDTWGIHLAPAPQDRLWVSIGRFRETVVSLLDDKGVPLAGWPISVPFAFDCRPLAAEDGTVRLLCGYSEEDLETCDLGCSEDRIFAWNSSAETLDGFPVSFEGLEASQDRRNARMIGERLVLTDQSVSDDGEFPSELWLVEVGADGAVSTGAHVDWSGSCCVVSPNGVAYATADAASDEDELQMTSIIAFDQSGPLPGWPVVLQGRYSMPAFGPDGELLFAVSHASDSQIVRLREDGTEAVPTSQPFERVMGDDELGGPLQPLVDEDANAFPTTDERVYGLDRAGAVLPGWPFEPAPALLQYADCPPGEDTGCPYEFTPPLMAPRGLVYLVHPPGEGVSGGRITVVNPDGSVRSGWPKTLQRAGARWDSVAVGENRVAYAVAIEPEPGSEFSASVLAFAPNGTQEWIRILVEP